MDKNSGRKGKLNKGVLTTDGFNTKIKMLKHTSNGLRNVEVYRAKMLLGSVLLRRMK